jgi:hypothetical protein
MRTYKIYERGPIVEVAPRPHPSEARHDELEET